MRQIIIIVLLLALALYVLPAQPPLQTRMGYGSLDRSELATFWPDNQQLTPSIFWSRQELDLGKHRKWWRNSITMSEIQTFGLKKIVTNNGPTVLVEPIIEGTISLYVQRLERPEFYSFGASNRENTLQYWIGNNTFFSIDHLNYKKVIKHLLPEGKSLHRQLGKVGFRFENLPSMVLYYNNFYADEQLTFKQVPMKRLILE